MYGDKKKFKCYCNSPKSCCVGIIGKVPSPAVLDTQFQKCATPNCQTYISCNCLSLPKQTKALGLCNICVQLGTIVAPSVEVVNTTVQQSESNLFEFQGFGVTNTDIGSVAKEKWLTDNAFEVLCMLMVHALRVHIEASRVRFAWTSCIIFQALHTNPAILDKPDYLSSISLADLDIWMIPIVYNSHFSVFVVTKPWTLRAEGYWVAPGLHECKVGVCLCVCVCVCVQSIHLLTLFSTFTYYLYYVRYFMPIRWVAITRKRGRRSASYCSLN
jgi:hypothetical protein